MMVDEMRYPPIYEGAGAQAFRQQYLLFQESLKASGVQFNRHYAASTACAPSRTSIFTGQYPSCTKRMGQCDCQPLCGGSAYPHNSPQN
jgi:choline-sulfatase